MDANYQLALANARACGMKFSLEDCEGESLSGTSVELWNLIGQMPGASEDSNLRVWGLNRSQLNDGEYVENAKAAMALKGMEIGIVPLIVDYGFEVGDALTIKPQSRASMPHGANYDNPGIVCSIDDIDPGYLVVSWIEGIRVRIPVYAAELVEPQSVLLRRKVA